LKAIDLKFLLSSCVNPTIVINRDFQIVEQNVEASRLNFNTNDNFLKLCSFAGDATKIANQWFKSSNKKRFHAELQSSEPIDGVAWRLAGPFGDAGLVMVQFINTATARTHFIVSKVKKFEEKAKKAQREADIANKAKSKFLANMSHEIRTPLNGISGLLDLLLDTSLTEKQLDYITKASASASLLKQIISDVLDVSKIEANQLHLESTAFNLGEHLAKLNEVFEEQARSKNIGFTCTSEASNELVLLGDPTRLMQILMNLCSNAIKFCQQGGVWVEVCHKQEKEKVLVYFIIKDSGIGIDSSSLSTLFDPLLRQIQV